MFASRRKDRGKYNGAAHLRFIERVAGLSPDRPDGWRGERRCVIVEDTYSVHHSETVEAQAAGAEGFFLPPYRPDLNLIEPLWRRGKYQDLRERSYTRDAALQQAVDAALPQRAKRYRKSTTDSNRPA